MATASSCRPLPLLRRPLPPKQPSPLSSIYSKLEDEGYVDAEDYKALSRSSDFSTTRLCAGTKSKVVSPVRGVRFCGDVPAPISSVVKPYKSKGPDPLPARPPRKPRELPFEAFFKDSYVRPPPEFTLRDFVRRLPSRQRVDDDGEPMVSEQNYAKLTSWFAANKPSQSAIHSFEIDSGVDVPDVTPRVPARQLLIEMQFQSLDTSLSPEQEFLNFPEGPSTILPVTPAVSKVTIPASRYPPLPPIHSPGAVESSGTHVSSTEQSDQKDAQHLTTKTILIGQTTDERTTTVLQEGGDKKILNQGEGIYISREVKTRFEDQSAENYGKGEADMRNRRKEEQYADKKNKALTFELERAMECKDMNIILPSSQPEFFQGEELPRTSSPFVSANAYDDQMSPIEAVILNAMMSGSSLLNLRAQFLTQLPSLNPLAGMLTHLNLSFNDFWVGMTSCLALVGSFFQLFPGEILDLVNLVSLKLRNNPIKEIPRGVKKLKRLRVFEIAFNLLTSLPTSLFELEHLEVLDLSYNRLSFVPSEIGKLSSLRELNLEGNQLGAMPLGGLHLKLKYLRINNNFFHPLLWKETANNQPQRLTDMSALAVVKTGIDYNSLALPKPIHNFLESAAQCDCCGGAMYGQGLRVIRAPSEIFGVKQLPFLFVACTQTCRKQFAKRPSSIQEWFSRNIDTSSRDEGGRRLIF